METSNIGCDFCGHPHNGLLKCAVIDCDCDLTAFEIGEENMLKKLWKKIKSWIGLV